MPLAVRPLSSERPATAPPSSSRRTISAKKPRTVAATTTPTPTTTTQPQDTGRAPYAAVAGSSRETAARDPRLKGRTHPEKCFDTDHRLLVKTPEAKHMIMQQRPAKRQQEEDETANTRATKQKLEGSAEEAEGEKTLMPQNRPPTAISRQCSGVRHHCDSLRLNSRPAERTTVTQTEKVAIDRRRANQAPRAI
ncbi:hypothetical protein ACJJTC_016037 [Scirpophaga incertulas]